MPSNQTRTSLIAVRLGLAGFILPFFFLDNPLLLYDSSHDALRTVWAIASASLGVAALAAGLEGRLLGPCNPLMRLMLLGTAGLAIHPGLLSDAVGLGLFAIVLVWSRSLERRETAPANGPAKRPANVPENMRL